MSPFDMVWPLTLTALAAASACLAGVLVVEAIRRRRKQ